MPTTRKRGAAVAVAMLGVLLGGTFAGCSVSTDDEPEETTASAAPEPTPTETSEPSVTPTEPTPAPSESASPTAVSGTPEAALLSAAELPQLNSSSPWADGKTDVPGATSFGLCQQFDLLSIGAMSALQRDYTGADDATAGQQVLEFPDAQTAVRADKVLQSWHRDCRRDVLAEMSSVKNPKVRPISQVTVPHGKGWWYLVSYTRGGTGHFHSFGVTFLGNRMTVLTMDHDGQDHIYEPGQDPMELAVKAASAKMAG
jgi:hypothetical protein